jgi:hypothetical protein
MCTHIFVSEKPILTIRGHYLYLYKCTKCGLYDYGLEGEV